MYRVLTINPGSTSTKVGYFEGNVRIFAVTAEHDAEVLNQFSSIVDQLPYRRQTILEALEGRPIDLEKLDAVVGRGGGLLPTSGGTYLVDDLLLDHATRGANGVVHPAQLGAELAREFAEPCHAQVFVVNPPDVDELQETARMTGVRGIYRQSHIHALNQKETAIRHADLMGRSYEDCNFIVCHIGGGLSVAAHRKGRMVDGNDIVCGEGPMAPTRCGALPAAALIRYCFSGVSERETLELCTKRGGFVSHLDTADAKDVSSRAAAGERYPMLIWESMIYQIVKYIGAMACTLEGKVDGILLGGGMVYNRDLVEKITDACRWIAPVTAYPGEFELEAMAAGAIRVLSGKGMTHGASAGLISDRIPVWTAALPRPDISG